MEEEHKEEKVEEEVAEEREDKTERTEEERIEERKEKLLIFLKKPNLIIFILLIVALILGVYIRSLPMQDHGGLPGLWDITTNTWTLGPDLDPWVFLRYAEIIVEQGSLSEIDMMRNVPLGFDPSLETKLLPYMIAGTYWFLNIFSEVNIEFAGAVFPVIMFALTIISFFLFVREIFVRKDKKSKIKANIISLISTFFMIVIPTFLSRTVAGIPEKESAAFFFMFLTFYFFLKAWKADNMKRALIFAILSGISTACMGLIWGGISYIFVTLALASTAAFILNKVYKKEIVIYALWIITSFSLLILLTNRFSLKGLLTSLDSGLAFMVLFILVIHFVLWNTKLKEIKFLEKIKIPKNILSLIIAIILGILLISIFLGPSFIINKIKVLNQVFFRPVTGRWNITVAENRQPFFTEWGASFGPFIRNIPILFWLFFIGSVVLFKEMLKNIKKKDSWILTGLYVLFFFGLVFSRYSGSSLFNGENFISKFFYYSSSILLIGSLIYYYVKYHKEDFKGFEKIEFEFLFLFSLFVLCLFTARSAVRLIMVLAPIAPIFLSFLIVDSISRFKKIKDREDNTKKIILGALIILILILSIFIFWNFYKGVKGQAYNFIPSYYNQQWQKAMSWVREETPEDAVFSHWWDYGYWVQSIGKRATVLDGGNVIPFWNYWMGRVVLTGDNEPDALEFLYNHDATHLLIDSTDIGKYTAFSSIGSDENYDRYSWISIMVSDQRQIQETRNGTKRLYQGGNAIDEDLVYNINGKDVFLPAQRAGIGGITIEMNEQTDTVSFNQPIAIFVYEGQQYQIPLRYIYFNGEFIDFGSGIEGTATIIQNIYQSNQGMSVDNLGALMYLSPRLMRGLLAQIYILDDPFNNFEHFELVHTEPNLIVDSLRSQGMNLREFVYYQGVQGPIKIWEISYTGEEEIKEEYLDKDASKYLDWSL
jgi:asparagine N-glycosylation enzyme membrane subunit Stt3